MITGHDFIVVASAWAGSAQAGEATYRSSTSRAYYGAFHVARAFIEDTLGFVGLFGKGKPGSHQNVQQALMASNDADAKNASRLLGALTYRRNQADYELLHTSIGQQKAALHSVAESEAIKNAITKAIATCQSRPGALAGMRVGVIQWKTAKGL